MRFHSIGIASLLLCAAGTALAGSRSVDSFNGWISDSNCDESLGCCDTLLSDCDTCGSDPWTLFPQDNWGIDIHGWVDAGFIGNTRSPKSRFNGPYNGVDRSNELMLNQFYLVTQRNLSTSGFSVGGRFDILYGEDFFLAESIGMEKHSDGAAHWNPEYYGLAIPQAYVSLGSQNLSVQLGHFYSIVGYEGVMAPSNFFYSKAYSYQFAGPFTQWGGQVNWNLSEALTVEAGLVNGWDALDRTTDRVNFIGRVKYTEVTTGSWTSFAIITGDDLNNPGGLQIRNAFTNRTRYSWLVDLPLTCRLEYVFHHWLGLQENGAPQGGQADWYGIDQYLYYTLNDCWKVGARFEWFRDEDGTRVGLNRANNPNTPPFAGDFYSLSLGVNWMPTNNITLRPEVRADWYDGDALRQPYDDGTNDSQFMLGLDAILRF